MLQLNSCIKLPLPDDEIEDIIQKALDWAIMNGLNLKSSRSDEVQVAPFVLLPSTFPKMEFQKAIRMQTILNELMHKVAYDYEFLKSCLSSTIKNDKFTEKLFKIYETVYKKNPNFKQTYSLGILRSDYMLYSDLNTIKQIEINTIASSFGGLSTKASEFHRFILSILGHSDKLSNLPINNTTEEISLGLIQAWTLYNNLESVILFIIEDFTINLADQRFVEFQIQKINPNIKIIRKSFKNLINEIKLGANGELIVGKYIVSVVYYRIGYDPSFYPTENEWNVRLIIEQSVAIKCPSIQYHLAGTKKVQQMLSEPNNLKRFIKNEEEFKQVQDLFVNMYHLEYDENGNKAAEMALKNPENYVLKPQREGGGHNIYGNDIKQTLECSHDRNKYILMEKINPPTQMNYLFRAGSQDKDKLKNIVSELGIYGVIIGNNEQIIRNIQAGFLLRTKLQTSNEGGVAAGFGALDSPFLVS